MASAFEPERASFLEADGRSEKPSRKRVGKPSERAPWEPPQVKRKQKRRDEKQLACCDRLFFLHMRKAAGTSLRTLLEEVSRRHGLELEVQEGKVLDPRRLDDQRTFTVTCLREPVDRICSLYNYQGRWAPPDREQKPEAAVPFATWLKWVPTPRTWKLWDETADYYTKTLGGGPVDERGIGVDAARYARALRALTHFDLVLVSEGFGVPEYDAWWTACLGLDRSAKMPKRRATRAKQNRYDVRHHLTEELLRDVQGRNQWDALLYRYARTRSPVVPADAPTSP